MKVVNVKNLKNLLNESNSIIQSKNPFNKIKNLFINYRTSKNLSKTFEDYSEFHLSDQAKIIYEDTRKALIRKEYPILIRSLTNFEFTEDKIFRIKEMNKYLEENLKEIDYDTSKWQLVMIRLSEDNSTAFATFRFNQRNKEKKENKVNYINFIRDCRETKSFYSWKILQNSLI